jgi:hypothetical protein
LLIDGWPENVALHKGCQATLNDDWRRAGAAKGTLHAGFDAAVIEPRRRPAEWQDRA